MKLAPVFQNHAVLQRDLPLPVWGRAEAGGRVTVRLADHEAVTTANEDGHWLLRLPPLPAGGPHELVAESASGRVQLDDVLIGDVWLCSGQSNMAWALERLGRKCWDEVETLPQVRLLTVNNPARLGKSTAVGGQWNPCTPESLAAFSAVGGYFGRALHHALGVPVGLICNAWGGSRIQAWISRETLLQDPVGHDEVRYYESHVWQPDDTPQIKSIDDWVRANAPQDPGNLGLERGWASPDFDDVSWPLMSLPCHWNKRGHPYNGIFWFRRTETVPESWLGQDIVLSLGAVDKFDDTWVNGEHVGGMGNEILNAWCQPRIYTIPARLIGPDRRVTIAVRAISHVRDAGLTGPAEIMRLYPISDTEKTIPLHGDWRYAVELNWGMVEPPTQFVWGAGNHNSPHILFDNRVAPLIPYGLRGVIWYQGETNANANEASLYRRLLPMMIRDWRRAWGQGDFPFLQVQLANYKEPTQIPKRSGWAELREAQLEALKEPATGIAVAIDIGDADDIHPPNKRDVGLRLARWALAEMEGCGGVPSGPLFSGMKIDAGGRVRCSFRHIGTGLVARDGALRHFALAGRDRVFKWADASIDGTTVVVSSNEVPEPMAVRYAWADNPDTCNLYNKEGLPASPFRSDSWPE